MTQEQQNQSVRRLMQEQFRVPVEQAVSAYLDRTWRITETLDKTDEASHPAAVLSDGNYAVFVKLGEGSHAHDQLNKEMAGLRLLRERSGVFTPTTIATIPVEAGALLILEAVQVIEQSPTYWRQLGQSLAQLHLAQGETFGLEIHGYWGSLYQDNTPHQSWPNFFWQRRIAPRLKAAIESGNLPPEFGPKVEELGQRLPELCGPPVKPSLIHGDAHQNNFISTTQGPAMIDPAAYYGHPEIDLAFLDFFASVPETLFQGYQEVRAIDAGFRQRKPLWLVPAWIAMVEVDGPQHIDQLQAILQTYD